MALPTVKYLIRIMPAKGRSEHMPDVVIVGGGLIGLGIAWRCSQGELSVTVVDPAPGRGASHVAAGMLAPVTEAHFGEEMLLRLNLESSSRFAAFAAELEDLTGQPTGYRRCGTLAIGFDSDDMAVLDELLSFQRSLGLDVDRLTSRECRRLEPLVAPTIRGGLLVSGDHQADPRRLTRALLAAVEGSAGAAITRARAAELISDGTRATGIRLDSGETIAAGTVVLAAGAWSGALAGLPPQAVPPIRPVKGQILRLQSPASPPVLARTLRAVVRGSSVYLVPRADGELVIGATTEEQGFDTTVTAGAMYQLLRDARGALPTITELVVVESAAGIRPASPDNAPIIGPTTLPGLVVATGHYRNGVLLTPITADSVAQLLRDGELPPLVRPFAPARFTRTPERTSR